MGVAKYIKDEKDAIKEVIYQSGIKVKPVYTPEDLDAVGFEYGNDLGDPGEYPFTRSLACLRPFFRRPRLSTFAKYNFLQRARSLDRFSRFLAAALDAFSLGLLEHGDRSTTVILGGGLGCLGNRFNRRKPGALLNTEE